MFFYAGSKNKYAGLRPFGYSRDKRSDCVQVIIALIVTPEGFPVAYEMKNAIRPTAVGKKNWLFFGSVPKPDRPVGRLWDAPSRCALPSARNKKAPP